MKERVEERERKESGKERRGGRTIETAKTKRRKV